MVHSAAYPSVILLDQAGMTSHLGKLRGSNAHGIYTIKESDSLSTVAAFFYANGNYWPRIAEANRFLIGDNPDLIFAGMVLIIP